LKQLGYPIYFFLYLCLSACESNEGPISSQNAPVIGQIQTNITHYHPSYFDKWDDEIKRTIDYSFAVKMSDPQGLGNIYHLLAMDTAREEYHALLGGELEFYTLSDWYQDYFKGFERTVYNIYSPDRVNLKNWSMYAVDRQNNQTTRDFEFTLPDGEPVLDEQYVYSSIYENPDIEGIPGLEAMSISENSLSIVSNLETESYTIEFEVSDARAKNYALWFFNSGINPDEIGTVDQFSSSIVSNPIVLGQKVSMQLPWSEIQIKQNYSVEDVFGVHIVLLDEPVEFKFLEHELRSSYLGVSEYLTL